MQISVEKFQTKCLKLMDDIQKNHSEIIITKLGKPITKLVPVVVSMKRPKKLLIKLIN